MGLIRKEVDAHEEQARKQLKKSGSQASEPFAGFGIAVPTCREPLAAPREIPTRPEHIHYFVFLAPLLLFPVFTPAAAPFDAPFPCWYA